MTIRLLPPTLINQIAAGEVVERPASVIKELIENAIDANAQHIEIRFQDGGLSYLSLRDDGRGMNADDLELAVERHATSKLPLDDLSSIPFLGFRGEALPAMGAVSRLTITSRTIDGDSAYRVQVTGGEKSPVQPASGAPGTLVEIRDLFFATPARLKFMRGSAYEAAQIIETVKRMALAHPSIRFTLMEDSKLTAQYAVESSSAELQREARIRQILGDAFIKNSVKIDAGRGFMRLQGAVSIPTLNRANSLAIFLTINNRAIKDKQLTSAIKVAYQDVLAGDRYPYAALYLDIPADYVDVNVHPAKTEVRFHDAAGVRSLLIGAIREALGKSDIKSPVSSVTRLQEYARPYSRVPVTGVLQEQNLSFGDLGAPQARYEEAPVPAAVEYPLGAALAQMHETYILAQSKGGFILVDQHAAHERIVHEQMKADLIKQGAARQLLLIPEVIEIDKAQAALLCEHQKEFAKLGLALEGFGNTTILVREIPAILGDSDVASLIKDLAAQIEEFSGSLLLEHNLERLCATFACYGSVRAGRKLNIAEMNALLRQLEQTPNGGQCNHGRPTFISLELKDVEKLFKRR
ncbi:MAG: DNA mismatch repair endonuclease MutL [Dongiaceae bacterium]